MRPLFITLCILLTHLACFSQEKSEAASVLTTINRTDETSSLQIYLRFSALPAYEINQQQRRVDILLNNTTVADDIIFPEGDDRIVKILQRRQQGATLLSLFFRYAPQKVTDKSRQEPASIMLDILLGNQFSSLYPDLSSRLEGLTLLDRDSIDYTNPVNLSPYAANWESFFDTYESPITITPPPTYTLPTFPLAARVAPEVDDQDWVDPEIQQAVLDSNWALVSQSLYNRLETAESERLRDFLLLAYAEALVRSGNYREAHPLLQQISYRYPDTTYADIAGFLFTYLRNQHEPDFLGYQELKSATSRLKAIAPFQDSFSILLAEAAITAGDYPTATAHLQRDDIGFAPRTNALRRMRLADIAFLEEKRIRALVSYLQLEDHQSLIFDYPDSLARLSDLLYTHKRYQQAVTHYQHLAAQLTSQPEHALALYRLAMSQMQLGATRRQTEQRLYQLLEAFPVTEGAFRATMKQADLAYLSGQTNRDQALATYDRIAVVANTVDLREEALFKTALVYLLNDDREAAIRRSMRLLREFQSGSLRVEAQALIIQNLSSIIAKLVEQKNYIDALVLAQQNRKLFVRGWISSDMLYDLATAYSDLGFFDRSARTYKYLFDTSSGEKQEQIYLPLISSLFQDGQFAVLEDYADRFSFRYPTSEYAPEIFALRLRALLASDEIEQAALLLKDPNRPVSVEIDRLALRIHYDLEQWDMIIDQLSQPPYDAAVDTDTERVLMLAESFFQVGLLSKAAPLFRRVIEQDPTRDMARFRLGQIALDANDPPLALKRFSEIADEGVDPLWKKLAAEERKLLELQTRR